MKKIKNGVSDPLEAGRRAAFGAWLAAQMEALGLRAGMVRWRLNQLGAAIRTDEAVHNWRRGENWVDKAHLLQLVTVLWSRLKESGVADEARRLEWCGECLDWLALHGLRAAELCCNTNSAAMRDVLAKLQAVEQAEPRWGFRPGALSTTLATREMMAGAAVALLSVSNFRQPRYRALILYGGSGHGQTTLARQLEADARLGDWYRGGIVWLNLRGAKDEAWVQTRLLKLLEVAPGPEALSTLHRLLCDPARRFLLILEEVEDWNSLSPLLRWLGRQAQVLVTTSVLAVARERLADIWDAHAVICQQVTSFSEGETRQLAAHAGTPILPGAEDGAFLECWRRVGGHPEMVKALLRQAERRTWVDICATLRQPGVDLAFAGVSGERLTLIQKSVARLAPVSRDYVQQLYEGLWEAEIFEPLAAGLVWSIPAPVAQVVLEQFEAAGLIENQGPGIVYRLLPMVQAALRVKEKTLPAGAGSSGLASFTEASPPPPKGGAGRTAQLDPAQLRQAQLREQSMNRRPPEQVRAYLALRAGLSSAAQVAWDQCWELPWGKYYSWAAWWRCFGPVARQHSTSTPKSSTRY